MKKIIFLLIIFCTQKSIAQNYLQGEVITIKGDTLKGYIKKQSDAKNAESCIFSYSMKGKNSFKFSTKNIISYKIFDGKYYVAKNILLDKNETLFLEYLVNGIVDLYFLQKESNEYFLIEKGEEIMILNNNKVNVKINNLTFEKTSNQYLGIMQIIFNDSEYTKQDAKTIRFYAEDMIKIIKQYHNEVCSEYACLDYTKTFKKSLFFEIGVAANLSKMKLDFTNFEQNNIQPQINIGLKYMDLRKFRKFNFRTGLSFSKNSYNKRFEYEVFDPRTRAILFSADYFTVKLPIIGEANFNRKKLISPYISFGLTPIYLANLKYSIEKRVSNEGIVPESFKSFPIKFRKLHYGINFTSGFYFKLSSKNYLLFSCPIEYRVPIVKSGEMFDFQKHYSLQPSIAFGFGK